ncbi:YrbI family 3-deoxy-D-manno-octulosonate 8-phosphate phosphatase [Lachnospiraceae bacterium A4]|nr:YrbI family 3-deoxy-D-manno-octulosonate 8-phosphate phosphatase [Lachnospiraceae bacterium A4]
MNVALIPVRGGSKSIPLKNIKEIAGKPLVYWTAKAANDCKDIDIVYIATDSEIIRKTINGFKLNKVRVIDRGKDTATDTASSESVMMEFARKYEFDNIVLVQATSPLLKSSDIENGFKLFHKDKTDSVVSVVRQKRFIWETNEEGYAASINYNIFNRPRRQEFKGYLVENGAFYITSKKALIDSRNRISGNIKACEMDESTYFEVDEENDWIIIEQQLRHKNEKNNVKIKMFLTDCDGCLTDGGMYYSENGDEMKKFSTRDGMGFRLLKKQGIITGIITAEKRRLNQMRAEKLDIDEVFQDVNDKVSVIRYLCDKYHIMPENVVYVGDDINDLEAIKFVGYGCCVRDAHKEVKKYADYISDCNGGQGAVRDIIDKILDGNL